MIPRSTIVNHAEIMVLVMGNAPMDHSLSGASSTCGTGVGKYRRPTATNTMASRAMITIFFLRLSLAIIFPILIRTDKREQHAIRSVYCEKQPCKQPYQSEQGTEIVLPVQ